MIKFLRIFFINILILVFLLLSVEIGLRIYLEKTQIIFSYNYKQNYPGLKKIVSHTIYKGMYRSRNPIDFSKKNDRTIRILCIGASTTEQITQSFSDTWCGLTEKKLRAEFHDINFESAIFANSGWMAIDNYLWSEKNLAASKADIVISLFGVNDLAWNGYPSYTYSSFENKKKEWNNIRSSYNSDYQPYLESIKINSYTDIFFDVIKNPLLDECIICKRVSDIKIRIDNNKHETNSDENTSKEATEKRKALPLLAHIERNPDPIVEFNDSINAFASLNTEQGISLIMLGQPMLWSETDPDPNDGLYWFTINHQGGTARLPSSELSKLLSKYNNLQKKSAELHGQTYISLNEVIPKTSEYFIDDCHFTDKGSAAVSEAIYPVVRGKIFDIQNKVAK